MGHGDEVLLIQSHCMITYIRLRREQLAMPAAGPACKAAMKAGQSLSQEEMERLITDLRASRNPYTCPHGRPIFVAFEPEEIARLFGEMSCP